MANKERIERDAERIRRASIPTIRDVKVDTRIKSDVVDSVNVHAISGTGLNALGKTWVATPKAVILTNKNADIDAEIDLYWDRGGSDQAYILANTILPVGASLVLDSTDLAIDSNAAGLLIQLTDPSGGGGTPQVDVRVKVE